MKLSVPFSLWLFLMFLMPHKEERFLYVVYPLFALFAAYSLVHLTTASAAVLCRSPSLCRTLVAITLRCIATFVFLSVSVSRILALIFNYQAPLLLFTLFHSTIHSYYNLPQLTPNATLQSSSSSLSSSPSASPLISEWRERNINVCVGKEWYRFPSHFFLPSTSKHIFRLQFIDAGFGGLLPSAYSESAGGAATVTGPHNDQNRAEPSRYVPLHQCHYVVDLQIPNTTYDSLAVERRKLTWGDCVAWQVVASFPFVHSEHSSRLDRAFFLPHRWHHHNVFKPYQLWKRVIVPSTDCDRH